MRDPRVVVEVEAGEIVLEVFESLAPQATGYFLGLVDEGVYCGSTFYRSTTLGVTDGPRLVQAGPLGGILAPTVGQPPPTPPRLLELFETTMDTGLAHTEGTLSLARDLLDTGYVIPEFFLCLGRFPQLDFGGRSEPDHLGFPAFGRVVDGLEVVAGISNRDTGGPTPVPMLEGEILSEQVEIIRIQAHRQR